MCVCVCVCVCVYTVSQRSETGMAGSPKLDNRRLEKRCLIRLESRLCCNIQMVGSEFAVKNMKAWIHPALSQRFRLVVLVVMVWGDIFLTHFGPLSPN